MAKDFPDMFDMNARVDVLGALPHAPLAMPKQVLENPKTLFARFAPIWGNWMRELGFGN